MVSNTMQRTSARTWWEEFGNEYSSLRRKSWVLGEIPQCKELRSMEYFNFRWKGRMLGVIPWCIAEVEGEILVRLEGTSRAYHFSKITTSQKSPQKEGTCTFIYEYLNNPSRFPNYFVSEETVMLEKTRTGSQGIGFAESALKNKPQWSLYAGVTVSPWTK